MKDQYNMTVDELLDEQSIREFFRLIDFQKEIQAKKVEKLLETNAYVDKLALDYYTEYKIGTNKKDYINICKSMVTGFLFQPPMITSNLYIERKIINDIFKDWNPEEYVLRFCKQLNMLFNL